MVSFFHGESVRGTFSKMGRNSLFLFFSYSYDLLDNIMYSIFRRVSCIINFRFLFLLWRVRYYCALFFLIMSFSNFLPWHGLSYCDNLQNPQVSNSQQNPCRIQPPANSGNSYIRVKTLSLGMNYILFYYCCCNVLSGVLPVFQNLHYYKVQRTLSNVLTRSYTDQ